jgi:rhomboid protease GluP
MESLRSDIAPKSAPGVPFRRKLQLHFYPFLKLLFTFIVGYGFAAMLIGVIAGQAAVKEWFGHLVLLGVLPLGLVLYWTRPRIMLFDFTWAKWRKIIGYHLVAYMIIMVLSVLAINYLDLVTSRLTELQHIDQLKEKRLTKFYTLDEFYFDKSHIGTHFSFDVEEDSKKKWYRKSRIRTEVDFYIVVPVLAAATDTINQTCSAWLGLNYDENYDDAITDPGNLECVELKEKSLADFHSKNLDHVVYLEKIPGWEVDANYAGAIQNCSRYNSGDAPVFVPVFEPFENRTRLPRNLFLVALPVSCLLWFLLVIIPKTDEHKANRFEQKLQDRKRRKDGKRDETINYTKKNTNRPGDRSVYDRG